MLLPQAILWALWPWTSEPTIPTSNSLNLTLRHVHGHTGTRVVFKDILDRHRFRIAEAAQQSGLLHQNETSFSITPRSMKTYKPRFQQQFFSAREQSIRRQQREAQRRRGALVPDEDGEEVAVIWDEWEVPGPNTSDRETLRTFAKMTWNSYHTDPEDSKWYDLGPDWGKDYPFGWEPDDDGFRGHVFVAADNKTVVVSIKGTTIISGKTSRKDKRNDNILFSCCCARVSRSWSTVCGCYTGKSTCDESCIQDALVEESMFYPIGTNLYNNITYMYPDANIWFTGHSLGGGLASLVGVTFGVPAVAFEAPSDRMASRRLHLPQPPDLQHVTHVFNTADSIAMGTCNGALSPCAIAGFAFDSQCHLGRKRVYDTVTKFKWRQGVMAHPIDVMINKILVEDWEEGKPVPDETVDGPECDESECYSWEFINR